MDHCILTINGGSSSIKFAVFDAARDSKRIASGKIERIGLPQTRLTFNDIARNEKISRELPQSDFAVCGAGLVELLRERIAAPISAIGHRVVHGGAKYSEPQIIDDALLQELRRISPFDPEHMPAEIALIDLFRARFPGMLQVACFDTAFHHDLPRVARILPLPRKYEAQGLRRYGFHGISYAYLMEQLAREEPGPCRGRVILCHFGNGVSLAAVKGGKCIDTSMSFTPAAGMPMGTRSGNLDPGILRFLSSVEAITPDQFHDMVNHQSGLLGISETSSDMRDLLAAEKTDVRAAEAIELFCYEASKWIGSFAAALNGLDVLVFAGGIGEHCDSIRARICARLGFLGVALDDARNAQHAPVISRAGSAVSVRVMITDEESMIAASTRRIQAAQK